MSIWIIEKEFIQKFFMIWNVILKSIYIYKSITKLIFYIKSNFYILKHLFIIINYKKLFFYKLNNL